MFFRLFEFAPDAIVVVDQGGIINRANVKTEEMFGYQRDELVGQPVEVLIPNRFASKNVGFRTSYIDGARTRPMGAGLELFGKRKDGSEFPVDIMLSPVEIERGRLVLGVVRDVTERKQAEVEARERREMLLKEIHHRVKNNLQVISSLLYIQSTYVSDPGTLEILTESQNRVKSIALIHEKLYRSEDLEKLDFSDYVRDLLADLIRTYQVEPGSIAVHTHIESSPLGIDTAIPCGLILNELVSNAFKHAFPTGGAGEVWIDLRPAADERYELSVRDDGVGLPESFDWQKSNSLGLKLVTDLTKLLDGKVEVRSGAGTTFVITFTELQYKERD
jgi:PAS domain S-box-containing protein